MNSEYDAYIQQLLQGANSRDTRQIKSNTSNINRMFDKLGGVTPGGGMPGGSAPPPAAAQAIPMPHYSQGWAFGAGHPGSIPAPMQPRLNIDLSATSKKKKDND